MNFDRVLIKEQVQPSYLWRMTPKVLKMSGSFIWPNQIMSKVSQANKNAVPDLAFVIFYNPHLVQQGGTNIKKGGSR